MRFLFRPLFHCWMAFVIFKPFCEPRFGKLRSLLGKQQTWTKIHISWAKAACVSKVFIFLFGICVSLWLYMCMRKGLISSNRFSLMGVYDEGAME